MLLGYLQQLLDTVYPIMPTPWIHFLTTLMSSSMENIVACTFYQTVTSNLH